MDLGKAVALTLLHLSAAFDTTDCTILFDCLRDWFGVDGTVLMWIKSYFTNLSSVLGPLLFTLYTTPSSHIISSLNATHHLYADDTQIYLPIDSRNFDSSIAELTECLACVQKWMDGVRLKLNPETEILVVINAVILENYIALLLIIFSCTFIATCISTECQVFSVGILLFGSAYF